MNVVKAEQILQQLGCDVFPITLIKFMLNKKKLKTIISRAENGLEFNERMIFTVNTDNCSYCKEKPNGMLCRKHTSIHRILNADKVLHDKFSDLYFYKNEIFKFVNGKLVIMYCPHTKLIQGRVTASKIRKFSVIVVNDIEQPKWSNIVSFSSNVLFDQYVSCWFNDIFTIVTIPEDKQFSLFCLIPNK